MMLLYGENTRSIGGLKRRQVIPVLSEEYGELTQFKRTHPDHCELVFPEKSEKSYKSRRLPVLLVDVDSFQLLEDVEAEKVSGMHMRVLTWVLRRQIYQSRYGNSDLTDKFFDAGIRGSVRELLRSGSWVDSPKSPGLKNFQEGLEKIDLGRGIHLNFSSGGGTGDQLFYREKIEYEKQLEEMGDPDGDYRDGGPVTRERLRKERPWMAQRWIGVFGQ